MAERGDVTGKTKPIRSETLDGCMRLEVHDASRQLVGDRWLVAAVFRLVIPVDAALSPGASTTAEPEEIRSVAATIGAVARIETEFEILADEG
ncbi:MAG: hypothetical protein V2L15_06065 [Desulfobacteraceae bacterium]|nr:hypothetical protein [Desulfobacteraceae bacterium]